MNWNTTTMTVITSGKWTNPPAVYDLTIPSPTAPEESQQLSTAWHPPSLSPVLLKADGLNSSVCEHGMIAPGCVVPFFLKSSGSHSSCLLDFGPTPIQCSPSSPSPARGQRICAMRSPCSSRTRTTEDEAGQRRGAGQPVKPIEIGGKALGQDQTTSTSKLRRVDFGDWAGDLNQSRP
jgi:hypothetical protein